MITLLIVVISDYCEFLDFRPGTDLISTLFLFLFGRHLTKIPNAPLLK